MKNIKIEWKFNNNYNTKKLIGVKSNISTISVKSNYNNSLKNIDDSIFGNQPEQIISGIKKYKIFSNNKKGENLVQHVIYLCDASDWKDESTNFINSTNFNYNDLTTNYEFTENRITFLFKPGTYGKSENLIKLRVGYYVSVFGLGISPIETKIFGDIFVGVNSYQNRNDSLNNFWRSCTNLTITGIPGFDKKELDKTQIVWSVSQAAPYRNINVLANTLELGAWADGRPGYASGGYIANVQMNNNFIDFSSQQQYFCRNTSGGNFNSLVWQRVFLNSTVSIPASQQPPVGQVTNETVEYTREPPFLYFLEKTKSYILRVPRLNINTRIGSNWNYIPGSTCDDYNYLPYSNSQNLDLKTFTVIGLDNFKSIITETDYSNDVSTCINNAFKKFNIIVLKPGIYYLKSPIILKSNQYLIGLGMVTLRTCSNQPCIKTDDNVKGIFLYSLILEAGITDDLKTTNFTSLLQLGNTTPLDKPINNIPVNFLSDIFFRFGGNTKLIPRNTFMKIMVIINLNNVLIDHIWVWRADHDENDNNNSSTKDWQVKHNIINKGNNIIYYGLFAEHAINNCVEFYGDDCKVYFFQNEAAYEFNPNKVGSDYLYKIMPVPDNQSSGDIGTKMYVDLRGNKIYSYYVDDSVTTHTLMGSGAYTVFFNSNETTGLYSMYKLPNIDKKPSNYKNLFVVIISPNGTNGGILWILNNNEDVLPNSISQTFNWNINGNKPHDPIFTLGGIGALGPIYLTSTIDPKINF